ncbi:tyrosine-type recombinase/integrase [Priestia megaterium]|uniref:tyrosine-type recombinase/integrase n=1 Tax=Priestia megaterium TaxID=1404 RepID=UPI001A94C181|nr:tyrosine-type recombinase/integrase [Priestia megaterium]QSX23894.1 tyrosine-type recombinase/integrase [Priestia megaterium]
MTGINTSTTYSDTWLKQELSHYVVKRVAEDGTVALHQKHDSYFLEQNIWNVDKFNEMEQFKSDYKHYRKRYTHNSNIQFRLNNEQMNLEFKYIYLNKLFKEQWSLSTVFMTNNYNFNNLQHFLNEKYPTLKSLNNIDLAQVDRDWNIWLNEKGFTTSRTSFNADTNKTVIMRSTLSNFLKRLFTDYKKLIDTRDEWQKDRWDVKVLHNKYGIKYNKSKTTAYMDFSHIKKDQFREEIKEYFKRRLLTKALVAETAVSYLYQLRTFFDFISLQEPSWTDLTRLSRNHILLYIEQITQWSKHNIKVTNQERYIAQAIIALKQFLIDIQDYESKLSPKRPVKMLIFPSDKPKQKKKPYDQVDHIPDFVLEQLFLHIKHLYSDLQPIVWIAFKTGLRISDVLLLKQDCLAQINGKYILVTDIEKTFVQGHKVPIDDHLAQITTALISKSIKNSNSDNNPEKFIFIRYRGSRKGLPYSQEWVRNKLNKLARDKNISNEDGSPFHFKTHQFRHTYAIKLLNNGTDILTVQELLAHASPEMTLRYARLLDDTKRIAFEDAIKQGVFHFDLNGEVQEIRPHEDIPSDILEMLWKDHKLNAIDNPYGTCHARINGNCPYSLEPPCLTCNGGSPCKDLAIGFSEFDKQKYNLLVQTTSKTIEALEKRGREDIAEKNKSNLERYKDILNTIEAGNIIFGRLDRLNRKIGDFNEKI